MRNVFIIVFLLIGLMACVESYDFQVTETAEVLVIDALFTSEQKAHQVRLSVSGALDDHSIRTVSGAEVWIVEDGTTQINLTESESGIYETASTVSGKPGSSYELGVRLKDGAVFHSTAEVLASPVEIDSIYGQYLELPSQENDDLLKGVQLFVDTHDFKSEVSFFRYEYEEDYIVRVRFPSRFEWDSDTQTYGPRQEDISTCYGHNKSQGLIITTTSGLSENRLTEYPIRMIESQETELNYKYAMILKQYSLSASAYQYYKNLQENNESAGSFFDKQKGAVTGNISNINDAAVPVLGFFEVSGVSTKTNFFLPSDFADEGYAPENKFRQNCIPEMALDTLAISDLSNSVMAGKNIYDFPFMPPGFVVIAPVPCSDCRIYADNTKPDYWD